jgi:hypothetical protein
MIRPPGLEKGIVYGKEKFGGLQNIIVSLLQA